MALKVPDGGEVLLLKKMLNHTAPDNVKLKLFINNVTPAEDDVVGTYTEATGAGYAAKTLTGGSWTVETDTGVTTAEYAEQEFVFTGAQANVYGYYVTDSAGTGLLWAERFTDGPYSIPAGGGSITVTPKIVLE